MQGRDPRLVPEQYRRAAKAALDGKQGEGRAGGRLEAAVDATGKDGEDGEQQYGYTEQAGEDAVRPLVQNLCLRVVDGFGHLGSVDVVCPGSAVFRAREGGEPVAVALRPVGAREPRTGGLGPRTHAHDQDGEDDGDGTRPAQEAGPRLQVHGALPAGDSLEV